jgi:EAL domain-containing protein (putative c-di-GMP-specific phosphodiesterase class I)
MAVTFRELAVLLSATVPSGVVLAAAMDPSSVMPTIELSCSAFAVSLGIGLIGLEQIRARQTRERMATFQTGVHKRLNQLDQMFLALRRQASAQEQHRPASVKTKPQNAPNAKRYSRREMQSAASPPPVADMGRFSDLGPHRPSPVHARSGGSPGKPESDVAAASSHDALDATATAVLASLHTTLREAAMQGSLAHPGKPDALRNGSTLFSDGGKGFENPARTAAGSPPLNAEPEAVRDAPITAASDDRFNSHFNPSDPVDPVQQQGAMLIDGYHLVLSFAQATAEATIARRPAHREADHAFALMDDNRNRDRAVLDHLAEHHDSFSIQRRHLPLIVELSSATLFDDHVVAECVRTLGRSPGLSRHLILSIAHADWQRLTSESLATLIRFRAAGARFALRDVTDLALNGRALVTDGFRFVLFNSPNDVLSLGRGARAEIMSAMRNLREAGLKTIVANITSQEEIAAMAALFVTAGVGDGLADRLAQRHAPLPSNVVPFVAQPSERTETWPPVPPQRLQA